MVEEQEPGFQAELLHCQDQCVSFWYSISPGVILVTVLSSRPVILFLPGPLLCIPLLSCWKANAKLLESICFAPL